MLWMLTSSLMLRIQLLYNPLTLKQARCRLCTKINQIKVCQSGRFLFNYAHLILFQTNSKHLCFHSVLSANNCQLFWSVRVLKMKDAWVTRIVQVTSIFTAESLMAGDSLFLTFMRLTNSILKSPKPRLWSSIVVRLQTFFQTPKA